MSDYFRKHKLGAIIAIILFALMLIASGGDIGQDDDTVRASAILTTGYVASSAFLVDRHNQLNLLYTFTKGSATALRVKIEFSQDTVTWYQEEQISIANGIATHVALVHRKVAAGNGDIAVPLNYEWYRVSVLAEDDATGTLLAITGVKSKL